MAIKPIRLRRSANSAAFFSMVASAVYFGLFDLPRPTHGIRLEAVGIAAPVALALALAALHLMVRKLEVRMVEPARSFLETAVLGIAFLFMLYHLSHTFRFAAPVALTIDTLIPQQAMHWATLLPGLLVIVMTQAAWARGRRARGRGAVQ